MFSFFKKKTSPPSSPEQSPIPTRDRDNDYVVVGDPRNRDPNLPQPLPQSTLYPNFDRNFGLPQNISNPIPPPGQGVPASPPIVNYMHGIPFKLSTELSFGNTDEITKIQVDDILALITSKLEVKEDDYDFGLERSIINENLNEC